MHKKIIVNVYFLSFLHFVYMFFLDFLRGFVLTSFRSFRVLVYKQSFGRNFVF